VSKRKDSPDRAETSRRRDGGLGLGAQIGILIGSFALATGIAELTGAANLGVAVGIGQIAFALTLVALIVRYP
jgi:hypothetical protein